VRWQAVALPPEHGSWGLVGEPVALGLLVALAWASLLVGVGAFAGFLAYRPAKLAWGDLRRGRRYPRTALALRFAAAFGLGACLALAGALLLDRAPAGPGWLLPFALAAPFAVVFVVYDLRPGRSWQGEVAAPVAFAATAAAMAWAGGLPPAVALSLWAVMSARSVPSVLYVRERLRLERGRDPDEARREPARPAPAVAAHLAGLGAVAVLAAAGWLPWLAVLAVGLLLARAAWGLSALRRPATPRAVGFGEIAWGVVTVALVAAGWWAGW
jgi:hypothetical protein